MLWYSGGLWRRKEKARRPGRQRAPSVVEPHKYYWEGNHCCSTMARLCASWALLGSQKSTAGRQEPFMSPVRQPGLWAGKWFLDQPCSRCSWHRSLNWFVLRAHVQKPSPRPWLPSTPPVPTRTCVHLVLVVCVPSFSPHFFPWHGQNSPDPSYCWDLWGFPPLCHGREPGYTVMEWNRLYESLLLCWNGTWEEWGLESRESNICKLLSLQLGTLLCI